MKTNPSLVRLVIFFVSALGCASFIDPFKSMVYPPEYAKLGFLFVIGGAILALLSHRTKDQNAIHEFPIERTGVYRWSRNPLLLGLFSILMGLSLASGSLLAWVPTIYFITFCNKHIIIPSENALKAKSQTAFEDYQSSARRWI